MNGLGRDPTKSNWTCFCGTSSQPHLEIFIIWMHTAFAFTNLLSSVGIPATRWTYQYHNTSNLTYHNFQASWILFVWQTDILAHGQRVCFAEGQIYEVVVTLLSTLCRRAVLCKTLTVHSARAFPEKKMKKKPITIKRHGEDVYGKNLTKGKNNTVRKQNVYIWRQLKSPFLWNSKRTRPWNQWWSGFCFCFPSTIKCSMPSMPFNPTWLLKEWHFKQYLK